jgi:Dolichyl-phosphate-mannose-protein mannosyltransferase
LDTPTHKVRFKHLLILSAVQFLLGIFYLGSVPRIYIDEAWDASLGYEFAQTGVLRHPFIHNFGGMEVHFVQPRIVLPIICAGIFKVIGYSIAISRWPSLLMGVLAVIALYYIAEQFFGNKQSFFICLAAIIYPWFWINSRRCRPEMYYTALALLFLWAVISYFRRDQGWKAFLTGILGALVCLTHPNGLIIIFAIGISWIMWKEKPHLLKFTIWAFTGFIITILPYVIYVFWAVKNQQVSFLEQIGLSPIYSSVIGKEVIRWKSFLQLPLGIPIALVMFASWLLAWWKSMAEDKLAVTIVTIYILALPLINVNQIPDYLVVTIPFFSMLIIRLIYRLREFSFLDDSKKLYYTVKIGIVFIYLITSLPAVFLMLYKQHDANFNYVVDEVAKVVGPKERVYADPVFWVGHDRYIYGPYIVGNELVTGKDVLQWAYSQSLDYVIRTSWDNGRPPQGFRKIPNKMPDLNYDFSGILCKKLGTKVYEFYNEQYGPVEIYKLDWSNAWKYGLKKQEIK